MMEKPILFSGEMVRAILDERKTQTRRIVKPQPSGHHWENLPGYELRASGPHAMDDGRVGVRFSHRIPQNRNDDGIVWAMCPCGSPGDRLWVRETFQLRTIGAGAYTRYQADGSDRLVFPPETWHGQPDDKAWRPSIHMPRWASRITLEIVSVRVERLWSISRGDAIAEGCPRRRDTGGTSPVVWFHELWESINWKGSWSVNPWVWVIEFKRLEAK